MNKCEKCEFSDSGDFVCFSIRTNNINLCKLAHEAERDDYKNLIRRKTLSPSPPVGSNSNLFRSNNNTSRINESSTNKRTKPPTPSEDILPEDKRINILVKLGVKKQIEIMAESKLCEFRDSSKSTGCSCIGVCSNGFGEKNNEVSTLDCSLCFVGYPTLPRFR